MKRAIMFLVVCLTIALGLTSAAFAQDAAVLNRIVKNGEIRVGMSGTQPPFAMKNKSGVLIGYEVDVATLLADAIGVELKIVEMPFGELLPAMKTGKIDIVMSGMTMTPERNLQVAFIGPYIVSGKSMLSKTSTIEAMGDNVTFNKSGLVLAALSGSTSQKFVEAAMPMAELLAVRDYDEAVQAVLNGKADAMVADYPICAYSQMRNPNAGLTTLAKPLTIEPIGMALPPGDSLLLNLVQNYLSSLQALGTLKALENKWFVDGSWLNQIP